MIWSSLWTRWSCYALPTRFSPHAASLFPHPIRYPSKPPFRSRASTSPKSRVSTNHPKISAAVKFQTANCDFMEQDFGFQQRMEQPQTALFCPMSRKSRCRWRGSRHEGEAASPCEEAQTGLFYFHLVVLRSELEFHLNNNMCLPLMETTFITRITEVKLQI